jgi:hypothetical protein
MSGRIDEGGAADPRHAPPQIRSMAGDLISLALSSLRERLRDKRGFGMRGSRTCAVAATGVVLAVAPLDLGRAASGTFDGLWTVEIACSTVGDVEGYEWRFPAEVTSGFMSGLYHSPTNTAIGRLTGQIRADGAAVLSMYGRTGLQQRAVGHQPPGTPFEYTIDAHFDANDGAGKRNEQRPCELKFHKT